MAGWKLFGFQLGKEQDNTPQPNEKAISIPQNEDGAIVVQAGGAFGTYVDLDGQSAKNEVELITKYREMSLTPEGSAAIDDIVNEAIVMEENSNPIRLMTDDLPYDEKFKEIIQDEFEFIVKLLDFNNIGYEIFRRWYVDGRLFFHIIIDETKPREGIQEVRYIDPRKIRKVREVRKVIDRVTGAEVVQDIQEYYVFNERGIQASAGMYSAAGMGGVRIATDAICYVHSGLVDAQYNTIVSHLHKAIKPLNQLRMIEDSIVIYRLSRAPERRIFYIDIGQMPKTKAEAYMKDIMQRYRNKLVYDSTTGEVRDDKRHLSMLEDFWLPRREGGKGTEITTLPGGQNLGELQDVNYFQEKLYKALEVPVSRLKNDQGFALGRAAEISRDEVKFGKFIFRLRNRFTQLFDNLLKIQLIMKGVINRQEWETISKSIYYDFQKDSYFTEMKNTEVLQNRLQLLTQMGEYIGRYWSKDWVQKNILMMSDPEIEKMRIQMEKEGLPELPAGISIGVPVGMPGTDYAPPEYGSQAAQYDQMIGQDPMTVAVQRQQSAMQFQDDMAAREEEQKKQAMLAKSAPKANGANKPKQSANINKKKKKETK
jgi:hypothetical protein